MDWSWSGQVFGGGLFQEILAGGFFHHAQKICASQIGIVSRLGVKMTKILESTTYNPTHEQLWGYRSRWFAAPIFNSVRSICKKHLRILPNVFWSILKRFKTHSNVLETSWQCDDSFSITSCDTFKFPLKSWRSKTTIFNQKSSGNLSPPNIPSHRGSHKRCCHRCVALHRRRGGWHQWGIGHGGCHGLSGLDSHALALLAAFLSHGFKRRKVGKRPHLIKKCHPSAISRNQEFYLQLHRFWSQNFQVLPGRSYCGGMFCQDAMAPRWAMQKLEISITKTIFLIHIVTVAGGTS